METAISLFITTGKNIWTFQKGKKSWFIEPSGLWNTTIIMAFGLKVYYSEAEESF